MSYLDKLPQIETFVFDVDGVFTDGSVKVMEDGSMVRTLYARDGYAIQLAIKMGFQVVVITGGSSKAVKDRLMGLGVEHVYLKASDKREVWDEHCLSFNVNKSNSLYMGDDVPDYEVMNDVGLACCPKDAAPEIRSISQFISTRDGGKGCVRDIIEQTLRVQNKWFNPQQEFENFTW